MNDTDTETFHRTRPAITTIMPVRNGEKFIGAALESLRGELGPRDEILVVDDGSTDASAEIAEKFSGPVRVIQGVFGGAGAARNRGLIEVKTPWLTFLDADDLSFPDRIFRLGQRMLADDRPELVYGGQSRFFDDLPSAPNIEEPLSLLLGTMVAQADVFARTGLFDPTFAVGELLPWFVKVQQLQIRVVPLPGPVIRRRQHANNLSGSSEYRAACVKAMRAALAVRRA